ncbi:adhesion G-protein coupled receptor G5 isoform X2 [Monodelphis domestica]|uniref:Adhesion G-protein coupled receptor G5 n=2 Tax=Monodelphis domestica TaxID=13616 RepID=A0A5F8HLE8_MONDO|nr:adhesion G-protein coupled receptor G5 isoform X2 [Monodelphis domestica]
MSQTGSLQVWCQHWGGGPMMLPRMTFLILCLLADWGLAGIDSHRPIEDVKRYMNYLETNSFSRKLVNLQDEQRAIHTLEIKLKEIVFHTKNVTIEVDKIQALVYKLTCNFTGLTINSSYLEKAKTKHSMQFPSELTRHTCKANQTMQLICIYFNMNRFFQDDDKSLLLNNNILGASLVNHSVSNLKQYVNISFWHNESLDRYDLTCVFWKEGAGKTSWGAWSSEGCKTVLVGPYQVLCHCDHLTYFAVLMKLSSTKISKELLDPLNYISIVGCSLSTVASLFTILFQLYSRKKSDSTTHIHMNLHVSVILLNVTFLLSPFLTSLSVGCVAIAALLHYSLLSCLTWMAIEGFNLYMLLVRVYNIYIRRYILKLCVLGWGLPAIIVVLLLLVKNSAYGYYEIQIQNSLQNDTSPQNASMCWIKSREIHWVFVMGYAGVTTLFNLVVLIWAVKMLRGLHSREKWESRPCQDITTVLGVSVLLGITWTLAFFSFHPILLPQLFLFTIFNSFYGFFLFLWFCAQKRRSNLKAETSSSSQMTRTGPQNHNSPNRSPQPSSLTRFFSRFCPQGTRHQDGEVEKDMECPGT